MIPGLALTRVINFTQWARQYGHRAFLGEFGGPESADSLHQIAGVMEYLRANRDVWWGMGWYSAGPFWSSGYTYTAEPTGLPDAPVDRPQMSRLAAFFDAGEPPAPAPVVL